MAQYSRFQVFEMERTQSIWENLVEYNLSDSGVHAISIRELVPEAAAVGELLDTGLNYPQTNGTAELREAIAALYPGAMRDQVLVTVGCAEANYVAMQTVVEPGDEVVVMLPNYMQVWGLAHNQGLKARAFHLREAKGWAPDLGELRDAVTDRTRLIAVCNPNNPTGYILTEPEMDAVVAAAERSGAWILADEIYRGTERLREAETPTFWGRYNRVLATGSLSKAYGLQGARIGWVVAPEQMVDALWSRRHYTTISAGLLDMALGTVALSATVRPRLIRRGREYVRRGYEVLEQWLRGHEGTFTLVPPQAAAIGFPRYHIDISSLELMERLRLEESVLIVPGSQLGADGPYLRIGFGQPAEYVRAGLDRIHEFLAQAGR